MNDDPYGTLSSLKNQSSKVAKVVIVVGSEELFQRLMANNLDDNVLCLLVKPQQNKSLGVRLGQAINAALNQVEIKEYDYILKMDADVILPSSFVGENLKVDADVIGKFGYCIFIRVSSFFKILQGTWPELTTEDTYIVHKFLSKGCKVYDLSLQPSLKRKGGARYSWRNQFERGISMRKLGCEPFHVLAGSLDVQNNPRTIFILLGYSIAIIKRFQVYDFAPFIFRKQVMQLVQFKTLLNQIKSLNARFDY